MCGIVGYSLARPRDNLRLAQAVSSLAHRGPDAHGSVQDEFTALAHTRLAIIDLRAGQQPMHSDDGRYVIIFNGEIYNFPSLKAELASLGETFNSHSDTEVLLRTFIRYGLEQTLSKLRGMFAFAIWERSTQTLYLARDRLGVKPLVYHCGPDGFFFASEIQTLLALDPTLSRRIDPEGVLHYLALRYIPSPWTAWQEIRKLPPAHAMVVRQGRIERLFRYWQIDPQRQIDIPFAEAVEQLQQRFLEATKIRMIADVPLGAFLSGGVDSSVTVAAMAQLSPQAVQTFAIGFQQQPFNELPFARIAAEHLQTRHHETIVEAKVAELLPRLLHHFGEPIGDDSILPTFMVAQAARQQVTVSLTGDGADELFAGYRRHYHLHALDRLEQWQLLPLWGVIRRTTLLVENCLRRKARRRSFPATRADALLPLNQLQRVQSLLMTFSAEERQALLAESAIAHATLPESWLAERWLACAGGPLLNHLLRFDSATYLGENLLAKVDITSMMNSLECRSPFLDHQLVEWVSALPGHYKLAFRQRHKHLLKTAFADRLPPGFFQRQKQGFSAPVNTWMQQELATEIKDLLLGNKQLAPLLNQQRVENVVQNYFSGQQKEGKMLWVLFILGKWLHSMQATW
ncbi:MAG: asparagine synthase (glutamine-hydrolyzing) [Magnetococcales bacterium]|nr:asparagine synthase (glutamine-hydrolyzing) [Magnetococcales bacterium]